MAIMVFQHSDIGRPGRLGLTLRDHGLRLIINRPDRGDKPPCDFDSIDGVISLGGPQSVADSDRPAWMNAEIDFLREAHTRELPVLGICLGHQMLAIALGGDVRPMNRPEIGFHDINLTGPGQTDSVLAGVAWASPQFCHHGDEVAEAPGESTVLASSDDCKVHAFRAGVRTYGFQYHFEADTPLINELVRADPEGLARAGVSEASITAGAEQRYRTFARLADRLCLNLATLVFSPARRVAISSPV